MAANLLKLATSSTCAAALKGHIIAGCLHNDFSTLLSEFLPYLLSLVCRNVTKIRVDVARQYVRLLRDSLGERHHDKGIALGGSTNESGGHHDFVLWRRTSVSPADLGHCARGVVRRCGPATPGVRRCTPRVHTAVRGDPD